MIDFIYLKIPYLIGYIAACSLSFIFIDLIYQELWREIKDDLEDKDHKLHRWYGGIIGLLEEVMYVTAFLLNKYEFIGIWLAFKVVGRWERSRIEFNQNENKGQSGKLKTHVIYSIFTIGNALSIIYSVVGWKIILWLKDGSLLEAILLGLIVVITSWLLLLFAKRQSERISNFKKPSIPEESPKHVTNSEIIKCMPSKLSLLHLLWQKICSIGLERWSYIVTIFVFPIICVTFFLSWSQSKDTTAQLRNSNILSIYEAADRCIYFNNFRGGDRSSYEFLLEISKMPGDERVEEVTSSQIRFVKNFYKASERYAENSDDMFVCRQSKDCGGDDGKETRDNYDLKNALDHADINIYPKFSSRVAAAYLLGSNKMYEKFDDCEKKEVLASLIKLMKKDSETSLFVSKTALDSFAGLVNDFNKNDIFDFES